MNRSWWKGVVAVLSSMFLTAPALAHAPFGTAFKKRYDLRSVTCYACHVQGKDKSGKLLGREHLNPFGRAMQDLLQEKNLSERIEAAKDLPFSERKKVNDDATAEFLKALEQLEDKPASEGGKTWRELIQSGDMEGAKVKK